VADADAYSGSIVVVEREDEVMSSRTVTESDDSVRVVLLVRRRLTDGRLERGRDPIKTL
jgi:hypothetical protein